MIKAEKIRQDKTTEEEKCTSIKDKKSIRYNRYKISFKVIMLIAGIFILSKTYMLNIVGLPNKPNELNEPNEPNKPNELEQRYREDTKEMKKVDKYMLEVPLITQNPELYNGCEVTCVTMMLNYKGINAAIKSKYISS